MQSDKKHRRDTPPKMLAQDFALPYAYNVEDIKKAIINAQLYEKVSREAASHKTDRLEKKLSLNTANFWNNVQGLLLKHQRSLKEGKK
jgi:hypothetical protein